MNLRCVLPAAYSCVTHYSAFNLLPICKCQPDLEYNLRLQSEEMFILQMAAECEFFFFFARAPGARFHSPAPVPASDSQSRTVFAPGSNSLESFLLSLRQLSAGTVLLAAAETFDFIFFNFPLTPHPLYAGNAGELVGILTSQREVHARTRAG